MNSLVFDFLVHEGEEEAARCFIKEANLCSTHIPDRMQKRVEICKHVQTGNIEAAINGLNDLSPEILDTNEDLMFSLLRLQLMEKIRPHITSENEEELTKMFQETLDFASENLVPLTRTGHMNKLEDIMALVCFPFTQLPEKFRALVNENQRDIVAKQVNTSILLAEGYTVNSKLDDLLNYYRWSLRQTPNWDVKPSSSSTSEEVSSSSC
ncbi:proteasome-dependent catabolite inactivation protein [Schizosaccharomyces japonicus yFS275]|uniref:Proteasome-dependent catabolite inactivation protein n=1 Tax=Schizosaccharomyces japonicus (strain yFS275 / FY16936) TaxID=402676 RepID=B6JZ62_SCHJY|nr:proteasome-dependent catabolite inactivation protein [Schizosaccharomyces japonicus yFS275]EEB06830.1 proteasome-dependent catabolite inactivation protein [Schizosaccharomyces japonicus yFS275]